jgi:hypothetical protein
MFQNPPKNDGAQVIVLGVWQNQSGAFAKHLFFERQKSGLVWRGAILDGEPEQRVCLGTKSL